MCRELRVPHQVGATVVESHNVIALPSKTGMEKPCGGGEKQGGLIDWLLIYPLLTASSSHLLRHICHLMSTPSPIDGDGTAGSKNETRELFTPSTLTRRLSNVAATGIRMSAERPGQSCSFSAIVVEHAEGCRWRFGIRRGELLPLTTLWHKATLMVNDVFVLQLDSPRSPLDCAVIDSSPSQSPVVYLAAESGTWAQLGPRLFSRTRNWGHPKLGLDLSERVSGEGGGRRKMGGTVRKTVLFWCARIQSFKRLIYICWKNHLFTVRIRLVMQ